MKKLPALFIVLFMTVGICLAFADTLTLDAGTPTQCTPEVLENYLAAIGSQKGLTFSWDPDTTPDGDFTVHTGHSFDGLTDVYI